MTWILPIGRIFAWMHAEGLENLEGLDPPVIFAPNHQSHFDVPVILMALPYRWRRRIAPAMSKEFFTAHFHPEQYSWWKRFTNGLNYYLSTLFFNAFPLPQREAGALETLRYAGELLSEGWCVLVFPEGKRTEHGEIHRFQPGVGMMASRLKVPVVPVRLVGLEKILHQSWKMAKPGRAVVKFGKPLHLTETIMQHSRHRWRMLCVRCDVGAQPQAGPHHFIPGNFALRFDRHAAENRSERALHSCSRHVVRLARENPLKNAAVASPVMSEFDSSRSMRLVSRRSSALLYRTSGVIP